MNDNVKKGIVLSLILLVAVAIISGATYAFFSAGGTTTGDRIQGSTFTSNVSLNISSIITGKLTPTENNLIITSLNGSYPCYGKDNYNVCSIYQITMLNSSTSVSLNGYIQTNSATTYTTNNLKYQLFTKSGNTYTAASDMKSVPIVANATSDFTLSSNNINVSLSNGTTSAYSTDYYLAVWISDPGTNQLDDSNKTYNGRITFVSARGDSISANFS